MSSNVLSWLSRTISTTNYVTTVGVHTHMVLPRLHIHPRSHPALHPAGSPAALPQPAALLRSIPPSIHRQPRILASLTSSAGPTILTSSFCLSLSPPIAEHHGEPRLPHSPLPPPLPCMPPALLRDPDLAWRHGSEWQRAATAVAPTHALSNHHGALPHQAHGRSLTATTSRASGHWTGSCSVGGSNPKKTWTVQLFSTIKLSTLQCFAIN
jgi:hypothetical protein